MMKFNVIATLVLSLFFGAVATGQNTYFPERRNWTKKKISKTKIALTMEQKLFQN